MVILHQKELYYGTTLNFFRFFRMVCVWWESNPHSEELAPKASVSAIPPQAQVQETIVTISRVCHFHHIIRRR